MKRILLLISALMLSISALWAHDVEIDGIFYNIDETNKTAEVTYRGNYDSEYSNEYSGSVTIPETITIGSQTYSVTSIGYEAFYDCNSLTSVTIPNSVMYIGSEAFSGCSGLTKVNYLGTVDQWAEFGFIYYSAPTYYAKDLYINNELLTDVKITTANSIKNNAFHNCQSIKSVEIGESVTSIGDHAFYDCSGLTSVTIPNSVASIGWSAFYNCNGLTSITIPNSVMSIGSWAFADCSGLTSVTIGESVTSIGQNAFLGCSGLTEILVSSNNDEFLSENGVLYNKSKTTLIKYPAGKKDTSFTIPNSVTSISYDAFSGCSGLTSVTISNSVTFIGENAFFGTGIYNNYSNWDNGVLYIDNCLIKALSDVVKGSYTIKEGTRIIVDDAFYYCRELTSITIPNSVTSIGSDAFSHCSGLTSVTIPNSVTSIGSYAFSDCSGLTKVNYLGSVDKWVEIDFNSDRSTPTYYAKDLYINNELLTDVKITTADSIKNYAFYNCQSIKSVEIGNSVTSIGKSAFSGCSALTKVNYLGTLEEWMEGNFGNANSEILDLYIKGELLTDLKITSTDSIRDCAFYNCKSIKSIEIGNSVKYIGRGAFYGCSGLTSVTIPNSCVSIQQSAFYGCSALTTVTIPGSVTFIGSTAFSHCTGLTSLSICEGVKEIQSQAFFKCSELISFNIPNSVNIIGENVFNGTSFYNNESNWDNGVLYIDNCLISAKEDVIKGSYSIKEGTRLIVDKAFKRCSSLSSITIPNCVTSIGKGAFDNCSNLAKVNYLGNVDEWVEIDFGNGATPTSYANDLYINDELLTDVKISTADSIKDYAFYNCQSIKSVEIGNCVKYIGFHAFLNCSGLSSVTLPNSVTSIGDGAFVRCSGLTEVTIPNSVTSIGESVFANCSGLSSVTVPNSVTSIRRYAFQGCSGLTSIIIPNSITYIDYDAFAFCDNLKTVYNCSSLDIVKGTTSNGHVAYYADEVINACPVGDFIVNYEDEIIEYIGDTTINKIEIPEFVTRIEPDVFVSCANMDTIVWNAINCADFTETTAPFNAQVAQIKSVIFGNDVEYIPSYLCSDMTLLTEISIPGKVNSIGENAFVGCSRLRYITSYPTLVPLAKENSFNSYSAYLYVPCDYYDYYYLDDVFGKFKEIKCITAEEVEGSDKVEIEVDSNNNATIIWPSTGNASSYELVISKNGEVFCTLLFNENGQLTSIDFGNRSASVGFQFTVTGLDGASKYSYSIVAKDEKGNELESYNGTFTTNGYSEETAILETLANANITISDGLITCQDAEFTIYNTLGQDVTAYNGSLQPGVYVVSIAEDVVKVMMK